MRRIVFAFALILGIAAVLPALDLEQDAMILSVGSGRAICNDDRLSDIVPSFYDDELFHFESELRKDFSFSWAEENLSDESRAMLGKTLSPLLSNLLPCRNVVFSRAVILEDGSKSFRFKDMDKGDLYSVVCRNGKIVSLSLI